MSLIIRAKTLQASRDNPAKTCFVFLLVLLSVTGCNEKNEHSDAIEPMRLEQGESPQKSQLTIPKVFVGKWAEKKEWCQALSGIAVIHVHAGEYSAREGGGKVVNVDGDNDRAKVTVMYSHEGAMEVEYKPKVFEFVRMGPDKLQLIENWRTRELHRCDGNT